LANYDDYDLTAGKFREKIGFDPKSAKEWSQIFAEHAEFFRKSEQADDYSLILRRAKSKTAEGIRPTLSSSEFSLLFETAMHLQKHDLELQRERRAWVPVLMTGMAIVSALAGTVIGALIKK
jgi:hypothetical protein